MNNLLFIAAFCLVLVHTACAGAGAYPNVIGTFMGMADWYEFKVDASKTMGGEVSNYQQNTRLVFTEQKGTDRDSVIVFAPVTPCMPTQHHTYL